MVINFRKCVLYIWLEMREGSVRMYVERKIYLVVGLGCICVSIIWMEGKGSVRWMVKVGVWLV